VELESFKIGLGKHLLAITDFQSEFQEVDKWHFPVPSSNIFLILWIYTD